MSGNEAFIYTSFIFISQEQPQTLERSTDSSSMDELVLVNTHTVIYRLHMVPPAQSDLKDPVWTESCGRAMVISSSIFSPSRDRRVPLGLEICCVCCSVLPFRCLDGILQTKRGKRVICSRWRKMRGRACIKICWIVVRNICLKPGSKK